MSYIDREYAISLFHNQNIKRTLEEIPEEDVRPNFHGHWERVKGPAFVYWRCSVCRKAHYLDPPNAEYCPACGARMDEPEHMVYQGDKERMELFSALGGNPKLGNHAGRVNLKKRKAEK